METVYDINPILLTAEILLAILVVGGIVVGYLKIKRRLRRPELWGMGKDEITTRWKAIEEMVQRNDEMSGKLALMEADKLLDYALKSAGFSGATLGERLKVACYRHSGLRAVWPAHLLRNRLVHEASFHLSPSMARQAIGQFKHALQELGIL